MSAPARSTRAELPARLVRRAVLHPRPVAGATGWLPLVGGNAIEVHAGGRPVLAQMLEAIARAHRSVELETYILRGDATGRRFLDSLADRARAGVAVRLLYDAAGCFGVLPADALRPLREAGGEVRVFNPLTRLRPRWLPRCRDHRKLLVVDERVAFLGGLNIGDEYDGNSVDCAGDDGWRDTHARTEGPVVARLREVFFQSWQLAGGAPPADAGSGSGAAAPPLFAGSARCAVLVDGPGPRWVEDPGPRCCAFRDRLVALLDGARWRARLASPYFAPDRPLIQAIERAAHRGVQVELLLGGRIDHAILRRGARAILPPLLRAGVRAWEYVAAPFHAKFASFDGRCAIVGSSNLDPQSLHHSLELNLLIEDASVAHRIDARFERDRQLSRPVDLAVLARRGPAARLLDGAAARLLPWM